MLRVSVRREDLQSWPASRERSIYELLSVFGIASGRHSRRSRPAGPMAVLAERGQVAGPGSRRAQETTADFRPSNLRSPHAIAEHALDLPFDKPVGVCVRRYDRTSQGRLAGGYGRPDQRGSPNSRWRRLFHHVPPFPSPAGVLPTPLGSRMRTLCVASCFTCREASTTTWRLMSVCPCTATDRAGHPGEHAGVIVIR